MPDAGIVAPDVGWGVFRGNIPFFEIPVHCDRHAIRRQCHKLHPDDRLARSIPCIDIAWEEITKVINEDETGGIGIVVVEALHAVFGDSYGNYEV